jgi:hypothetical protein
MAQSTAQNWPGIILPPNQASTLTEELHRLSCVKREAVHGEWSKMGVEQLLGRLNGFFGRGTNKKKPSQKPQAFKNRKHGPPAGYSVYQNRWLSLLLALAR